MKSAFGIDHGEVSKARYPRNPTGVAPPVPGYKKLGEKIKSASQKAGEAHFSLRGLGGAAGRGVEATGRGIQRYPGASGTAILGGGGYGAYKVTEKDIKRRKKKNKR